MLSPARRAELDRRAVIAADLQRIARPFKANNDELRRQGVPDEDVDRLQRVFDETLPKVRNCHQNGRDIFLPSLA